jgi:hypothetical protein
MTSDSYLMGESPMTVMMVPVTSTPAATGGRLPRVRPTPRLCSAEAL